MSATSVSVVSNRAATLAPFCSALRVTLSGSMTPAARQLGEPLLELLPVVLAVRLGDLLADRLGPSVDRLLVAGPLGDGRVLGVDLHLLGPAQISEDGRLDRPALARGGRVELDPEV